MREKERERDRRIKPFHFYTLDCQSLLWRKQTPNHTTNPIDHPSSTDVSCSLRRAYEDAYILAEK